MTEFGLFIASLLLPVLGATLLLPLPAERPGLIRRVALVVAATGVALAVALVATVAARGPLTGRLLGMTFQLDGIALALFALNALLALVSVIFSRVVDNAKGYFWSLALAQFGAVLVFTSQSLPAIWAGWAITALCICVLLARWGWLRTPEVWLRVLVPVTCVLVVMALAFILVGVFTGTTDIPTAVRATIPYQGQLLVYGLLAVAFGATIGLFPLHFWLPNVHQSISGAAGLLLDGGLFSMAVYGFIHIAGQLAPQGAAAFQMPLAVLAAITSLYGGIALLGQHELRRVNAYCTITYAGIIGLAVATGTPDGATAAIVLTAGRTVASALLIIVNQMIHSRLQTLSTRELSGIASTFPLIAALMLIAVAGLAGVPFFSVLPGLIMAEVSVWHSALPFALMAMTVAGFALMIGALGYLTAKVCTGAPSAPVAAYVRHLAEDPFDIIVAGQRVPVGVEAPAAPADATPAAFTGDLAGLSDFELAEENECPAVIPIERLMKEHGLHPRAGKPAPHLENPAAAAEYVLVDELAGLADLPLAQPSVDPHVGEEDEWEAALRSFETDEAADTWDDDWDDDLDDNLPVDEDGDDAWAFSDGGDILAGGPEDDVDEAEADAAWDAEVDDDEEGGKSQGGAQGHAVLDLLASQPLLSVPAAHPEQALDKKLESDLDKLGSLLSDQSILIDAEVYGARRTDLSAMYGERSRRRVVNGRSGEDAPWSSTSPAARHDGSRSWRHGNVIRFSNPSRLDDDQLYNLMLSNLTQIERSSEEQSAQAGPELVPAAEDVVEPKPARAGRLSEARAARRSINGPTESASPARTPADRRHSPDDPQTYEILPDHTDDPLFRRSTLSWSELFSAVLLVVTMMVVGAGTNFMSGLIYPLVCALFGGAG